MKKEKKKPNKLEVEVDLKKVSKYHFVSELSNVFFPYEPYPDQVSVIASIQKAIANKYNALIESPTGTGKTLCLLVGALSGVMGVDCKKKIYYLTRTHSQISQVINEFKQTVYSCNLNVIASRQQLCINHNLSQLKGKNLEKACSELCLQNLCTYRQFSHARVPKPLELQEFKDFCKKQLTCPYFYTKQLTQKCQITILPFNYLLDWNLFQRNYIDLKDSVIIFDQAHNIDALCQQGSDIRLIFDSIYQTIGELKTLIKAQSKKMLHRQFKQSNLQCQEVEQMKQQVQLLLNRLKSAQEITFLSRSDFLQKIERYTTTPQLQGLDLGNYPNFCGKGKRIIKLFHKKDMVCDNFQNFIETIEKIFFITINESEFKKFTISITKGQLYLRCLDPSLCFQRIVEGKPRTIILSSGTMGNLDLWQQNLQIPFEYKITNQSFITRNQLYAQVKTHSDKGVTFNFSYHGKQNEQQFEQICKELNNLEKIIKGGIVVAFSNYQLLQKTLKYCHLLQKKIYFETKGGNVQDIYKLYAQQATKQGAFLFIIMKGRFSEGINFANQLCRCLIIVGIPFLPLKDIGVIEKMKFLETNRSKSEADEWYTQQSFKSLNQTLGRAIRNKDDYAVILLFEQRYQRAENIKHLSKWFTSCLRPEENTNEQIHNFLKASPWKNRQIILPIEPSTKNKSEPSLCERLQQFSTPSKSNPKKLKLIIESEQKTSTISPISPISIKTPPIELKQIKVVEEEEPSYKSMTKDLVDFFVKTEGQEDNTCVKSLEDTNQTTEKKGEIDSSENSSEIKLFLSSRSFAKRKILFDF